MLDYDFNSSQRHIPAGNLVGGARAPLIGRYGLQEMLDSREQFHRIQFLLRKILGDVTGQFPNAFENQFCNFGFPRVRCRAVAWERLYYLEKKIKQGPGTKVVSGINTVRTSTSDFYLKMDILRPVANRRNIIMLIKRERSLIFLTELSSVSKRRSVSSSSKEVSISTVRDSARNA